MGAMDKAIYGGDRAEKERGRAERMMGDAGYKRGGTPPDVKKAVHKHEREQHGGKLTKLKHGGDSDDDRAPKARADRYKRGGAVRPNTRIDINIVAGKEEEKEDPAKKAALLAALSSAATPPPPPPAPPTPPPGEALGGMPMPGGMPGMPGMKKGGRVLSTAAATTSKAEGRKAGGAVPEGKVKLQKGTHGAGGGLGRLDKAKEASR